MEATMTTTKADTKTRELNAKAKIQAQTDMKSNVKTLKPATTAPAEKPAKTPKAPKPITFTAILDEIITKGGTWEELIAKGTEAAKALMLTNGGVNVEFNGKAKLMSLIKYRMDIQGRKDYLGTLTVTDKGVM